MKQTTLEQVAAKAGVSRNTVARVLSGQTKGTWASTARRIERIRRIADQLGYRPNLAAQATRSGYLNTVCLLLSNDQHRSQLPQEMLAGITRALMAAEVQLNVSVLSDTELTDERYVPSILRVHAADGLLIDYNQAVPDRMVELLESHDVPSIWLNLRREVDAVYPDDQAAGRLAAERLLERGHQRIAYVDYSHGPRSYEVHYSVRDRFEGARQAVADAGLHLDHWHEEANVPYVDRVGLLCERLKSANRPTAIITYGDAEVIPTIFAAERLGLAVPADLSIVSFSVGYQPLTGHRLHYFRVPNAEVGQSGVDLLLNKLSEGGAIQPAQSIPFEERVGDTIATLTPYG